MPHDPYQALYIHIPFCASRCAYCDFATEAVARTSPRIEEYIESIIMKLREYARAGELAQIESIYIGGGTPTHIGSKRLIELIYAISLSLDLSSDVEFSVEANPESLDERMVKDMWALGVNRLSIGVQSFDDGCLKTLGRAHNSACAARAIEIARERFENVSIDLMCGLYGQTAQMLLRDIERGLQAGVTHLSLYPLTIEPLTPYYKRVMRGDLPDVDEDMQATMMEQASLLLTEHGFSRYEVSNFARDGYESRHNSSYWSGKPYLGIGYSAVTMTQNEHRRCRIQNNEVIDDLDRTQMAAEDAMLAMRMTKGLEVGRAQELACHLPALIPTLNRLEEIGLVRHTDDAWVPTERGWLLGNELYGELLSLAP